MPSQYTPTEIDEALLALAYCGGNTHRAASLTGVPQQTLSDWRLATHRDRYLELAERERPRLEQLAVDGAVSSILRAGQLEHQVMDRLDTTLQADDGKTKDIADLAATLQRITTSKGVNGTKLLELTGRPTHITEVRDGAAILRELKAKVPGLIIDSTATEEPQDTVQKALPVEIGRPNAREGRQGKGIGGPSAS